MNLYVEQQPIGFDSFATKAYSLQEKIVSLMDGEKFPKRQKSSL